MVMPERSFGRTVRYRRTKLGLSQAQLAELVGRSTPTIRSWERDKTRPNDPKVLSVLAAILGIDERHLFDKAEVEKPVVVETSPTVEQALATLSTMEPTEDEEVEVDEPETASLVEFGRSEPLKDPTPIPVSVEDYSFYLGDDEFDDEKEAERDLVDVSAESPAYVAPPEPYQQTPLTPTLADVSYMEDTSQRQLYRVRTLATLVAIVALVIAFIWAAGEGLGALGEWWDAFFGELRL